MKTLCDQWMDAEVERSRPLPTAFMWRTMLFIANPGASAKSFRYDRGGWIWSAHKYGLL